MNIAANPSESNKAVMRRLKKIMALSESSNPGEAAAALHQAETIMRKHGLSHQDVAMSAIEELVLELSTMQVSQNDSLLIDLVRTALGVEAVERHYKRERGLDRPTARVIFIGESCRVEIAKYAFIQLRRQLAKSMKNSFEQLLIQHGISKKKLRLDKRSRDVYARSWVAAVYSKIKSLAPEPSPVLTQYMALRNTPEKEGKVIKGVTAKDHP